MGRARYWFVSPRFGLPRTVLPALAAASIIAGALTAGGCGGGASAPAAVDSSSSGDAPCSRTYSSLEEVQAAVAKATPHAVICLSGGDYGKLSLDAGARSTRVTVRAEHPAGTTIEGAELAGDNLTLAGFVSTEGIQVMPGATGVTVEHNRVTGGGEGIEAGPTDTTTVNDTRIVGNQLIGPFGEDAIHLNRYHDSDGDGVGILIEGNEITQVRENGAHSDCLQTVWVGDHIVFRKNYLHDNRCQGFFVKDQPSTIIGIAVEDNLFLRNSEPCAPEASGCGQPSYLQIFGPYQNLTMRRNTVWQGEVVASFQEGAGAGTTIEANVVNRFWTNTNLSGVAYSNNTVCKREDSAGGSWPSQTPGETVNCSPAFANPSVDDYRLSGSDRGVDWAPREQHYGP